MNDIWEDMRKAKEEQYFKKQNQEALRKLSKTPEPNEPAAPQRTFPRPIKHLRAILGKWLRRRGQ